MNYITLFIEQASTTPYYEQIASQIRSQVLRGILRDGDQLLSIRALARELQVSVITTKRAYEELEREGVLVTSSGRGTFVRASGIEAGRQTQIRELTAQLARAAALSGTLGITREEFLQLSETAYLEQTLKG